jgi:hypothetical protein
MKALKWSVLLLTLCAALTVKSQQFTQADSLLDKLIGTWILNGTIDGKTTIHDVDVQRVLNGQYVQIKEVSREVDEKGNPLYEAIVYICWEEPKKQYSCLWLDNTSNGGISNGIIGRAEQNKDKIAMVFKFSNAIQFHTTFLYNREADTWQWLMDEENNGKMLPFSRVTLIKKM